MATESLEKLVPLASPIPPPVQEEVLNDDQWATLLAIADAFIPAIRSSATQSTSALALSSSEYTKLAQSLALQAAGGKDAAGTVHKYLAENASETPGFKDLVNRMLGDYSRSDAQNATSILLSVLGYTIFLIVSLHI